MEELFREMEVFAAANHVPIINERGRQAFLQVVSEAKPRQVLEIGTAIGYSALLIANMFPNVKITTLELSEERITVAKSYIERSPFAANINIIAGDAAESLLQLAAKGSKFDFVFIDAAKGQYPDYFRKIQPMLTPDVCVLADNVLFRGYVRGKEKTPRRYRTIVKRLREYIDMVSKLPFTTKILENGDGLAVTRRIFDAEKA